MGAIGTDLLALDQALGAGPDSSQHAALPGPIANDLDALEGSDVDAAAARARLATQLRQPGAMALTLSDGLSRRYFTHTESQLQSLAN